MASIPAQLDQSGNELHLMSAAYLPTILVQHLFTSFMWAIAEKLDPNCLRHLHSGTTDNTVKLNPGTFTLDDFRKTWFSPKLSHQKLENFVRYAKAAGLGNKDEILLCMVPALGYKDVLPNENILNLIPLDPQKISLHGWARIAGFYNDLLDFGVGVSIGERFTMAAVVHALEFVYLACEPYIGQFQPEHHLEKELKRLVRCLGTKFYAVLDRLLDDYKRQKRDRIFRDFVPSIRGNHG